MVLSILEMQEAIDQAIQKFGFFVYQDFDTEQIDLQINLTIDDLVSGIVDKFFGTSLKKSPQEGFQLDQVTLDNLRTLHVLDETVTLLELPDKDGYYLTIPAPYIHHIRTKVTVNRTCNNKPLLTKANIRISKSQDDVRNHPFHKTLYTSPLAELAGNIINIYTEGEFTLNDAKISYIKKPAKVKLAKDGNGDYDPGNSVNCDLDSSLHRLVVDETAVRIAKILEQPQQKIVNLQQQTI